MKITGTLSVVTLAASLLVLAGCGKSDSTTTTTSGTIPEAEKPGAGAAAVISNTVETVRAGASQAAQNIATQAQAAATAAVDQAQAAVATAPSQAQGLLDQLKSLVDSQKFQDAAPLLQQIASLKLTPEQQQLFDGLKAKVQAALSKQAVGEAAGALGGALGGKK